MGRVYEPAEDSLLLLRHVEENVRGSVLDMGTGSGVQAVAAALKPEVDLVLAVDIDPGAIEVARKRATEAGVTDKIQFRVSDLFEHVGEDLFDWIVFNPPYLPSNGQADEYLWAGGPGGGEVIGRFLSEAKRYLKAGGGILIVYSSLTELDLGLIREDYSVDVLEEHPLFFEKLFCALLKPLSPS